MASHPRPPLSRLSISGHSQLNMQQPMGFDPRNQVMYSPALPSALQGFHPPYPMNGGPLQTPMQSMFNVQPPGAPSRPSYAQHRGGQASMAQLAAVGIHPPNGMPMSPITPMGQGFHPSQMQPGMSFGGGGPAFVPRNRRTPSMGMGGPPKAVLGGPNRKVSPLPPPVEVAPPPGPRGKRVTVKFPQEKVVGEDEQVTRPLWARTPIPLSELPEAVAVGPPELVSAESFPTDADRYDLPSSLEVFLPGKSAWDALKKMDIEEKLQKLGVEPGSGSNVPHLHGARAASISSPADSALLYYKLNKLQQSQANSPAQSLVTSPYPQFGTTPSPNQLAQMPNRHGYSMSMAQPPSHRSPLYTPSFNPFGPHATIGDSPGAPHMPLEAIHAPQGRVPVTAASLSLPSTMSRPDSRPDFVLGFGVDVPEEREEDLEEFVVVAPGVSQEVNGEADDGYEEEEYDGQEQDHETDVEGDETDGMSTAAQTRYHSRHVSNALSLGSVGGALDLDLPRPPRFDEDPDQDAIGEWTGSEDLHFDGSGDEGSIGEWSNPSDEERARQARVQRRTLRHHTHESGPRRLPNFPVPPENTMVGGRPAEDDMISNPSEEGHMHDRNHMAFLGVSYTRPSSSSSGVHDRPLPPLPHSRSASGQMSVSGYDPALAHSRAPSQPHPSAGGHAATSSFTGSTGPTLNPKAKPFVFGAASQSGSWVPAAFAATSSPPPPAPKTLTFGHARGPSFGKPLNAGAMEFKPGGFTFQPPPAAPKIVFPPPSPRPLPQPPVFSSPARAMQGREKRQRRSSVGSADMDIEDDGGRSAMSSFRFPSAPGESPSSVRRSAPTTPRMSGSRRQSSLNASAQPFTFSGFSTIMPQDVLLSQADGLVSTAQSPGGDVVDTSTPKSDSDELRNLPIPPSTRQKRAPIPLDFKHPTHSNTVPAGLFKAVVNGDERTRRTVRSRLSSRDFEHQSRPSLDDLAVPSISRQISRPRLSTEPMHARELSEDPNDFNDFFSSPARRSSLPDANERHSPETPLSDISFPGNLTKRFENQHLEQQLDALFEDKIAKMRQELFHGQASASTDAKLDELLILYRSFLERDNTRGAQDSHIDARGEIDFEEIRDVIQQGHAEARHLIHQELTGAIQRLEEQAYHQGGLHPAAMPVIEQLHNRTVQAVIGAVAQASAHSEAGRHARMPSEFQRETLIRELMSVLAPMITTLRPEAVDYEELTFQLSQAVKPHISQLIDLASDKRETASLIVNSILPLLPAPHVAPTLDTDAIAAQLTAEIRRVIAPIDAFEIKEQVADLVVERLDCRLAVRDKAFNVDNLATRITDSVSRLLDPMQQVTTTMTTLVNGQNALTAQSNELGSSQKEMATLLAELPDKLFVATQAVDAAKAELLSKPEVVAWDTTIDAIARVESTVDTLTGNQKTLSEQNSELLAVQNEVLERLTTLPDMLIAATSVLQTAHAEFGSAREASKNDLEEIRRLKSQNTEIQVQLAKARGAHGQVRVEKDNLVEKMQMMEAEHSRLISQEAEARAAAAAQAAASAAIEARKSELEIALAQALERLKISNAADQTNKDRITELEQANRERTIEIQTQKVEIDALKLRASAANYEKEAAIEAQKALQKEHDRVTSQQNHWDDLHRATQQIETLTNLIGQADNEEVKELKQIRDRSHKLEGEHAALQKRFKDQESKVANSERAATTARQSLAQTQQRASEWERRAKEYESDLEMTRTKLDQTDLIYTQLEDDYSQLKLHLEEKDADNRLAQDRENNLSNQISTLETTVSRLQAELSKARTTPVPTAQVTTYQNGHSMSPPRPDSRASTAWGVSRSGTPVARVNGSSARSNTPPTSSVWDSMHAPKSAPRPRYPHLGPSATKARPANRIVRVPSPTPSTVSLAPTQGDDGWWQ